jgi:hypothetical protein
VRVSPFATAFCVGPGIKTAMMAEQTPNAPTSACFVTGTERREIRKLTTRVSRELPHLEMRERYGERSVAEKG